MEGLIVDAGIVDENADAGSIDRPLGQDGEFLEDHAQIGVFLDQRHDVCNDLTAIAAIVVEHFHQRDVAFGIAENDIVRIVVDFVMHGVERDAGALGLFGAHLGFELRRHALEQAGIGDKVFFDRRAERGNIDIGGGVGGRGGRSRGGVGDEALDLGSG